MTTSPILEKKLADKLPSTNINPKHFIHKIPRQLSSLYLIMQHWLKIKILLKKCSNKTISGVNNISNKLVRNLSEVLIVPLYISFNKSLIEGVFLDAMKIAEVIPLYKSKDRYLINN